LPERLAVTATDDARCGVEIPAVPRNAAKATRRPDTVIALTKISASNKFQVDEQQHLLARSRGK
jgi:hypothetical protein